MLILALDTSSRTGSIALLHGQAVLGEVSSSSDQPYSISFFSDLEKLLGPLNISLSQCDLFAVGAGPGSFTGLRAGLTAAKAWSEIFKKPVAAVSCLEAIASKVVSTPESVPRDALIAPVLDARRGQIFGCLYRLEESGGLPESRDLRPLTEEVVMTSHEFIELLQGRISAASISSEQSNAQGIVFVFSTPELIRPALKDSIFASAQAKQVSSVLAADIGRLGYAKALRGDVVDALHLDANYVRRPDAERGPR